MNSSNQQVLLLIHIHPNSISFVVIVYCDSTNVQQNNSTIPRHFFPQFSECMREVFVVVFVILLEFNTNFL